MTSVFVIGATGFIGNSVAAHFVSNGYNVHGLCRSEEKAKLLLNQEISPVIGKAQEPSTWEKVAESCDIIIESLSDFQDQTSCVTVQKVLLDILSKHKHKTVIYTSGVWVYGATKGPTDENSVTNPVALVGGRVGIEQAYLKAGAIVLRPGCVYGRKGSLTGMWFGALTGGKGEFRGRKEDWYWSTVHVDDCGDVFVKAAQKGVKGEIYNVVSQTENVNDILRDAAHVIGYKGAITIVDAADPFNEALALSQGHISSAKARLALGWIPKQAPIRIGIEKYIKSWRSYQK